jgi:hypothetical protein
MNLAQYLPEAIGHWRRQGPDEVYDRRSIFKYMDGAGEVYLSFAFARMLVRRFAGRGGQQITAELYDMTRPEDAFGIFARNREGLDVGVGQGSEYRSGYLIFWKGPYFGTIYAERETEDSQEGVLALGRSIAGRIKEEGALPAIIEVLPQERLLAESIRYFHKHTDLNQHYFLADDNILNLDAQTEALIANYRVGASLVYLLIVHYPTVEQSQAAHRNFGKIYAPEATDGEAVRLEDETWMTSARVGHYVLAVFDAPTAGSAGQLMQAAQNRIKEGER